MFYVPSNGSARVDENVGTTSALLGSSLTANSTTQNANSAYVTMLTLTYTSYGVTIMFDNPSTQRMMADIAVGAAASENVLIPDLFIGNGGSANASQTLNVYHFPIVIAQGTRVSARVRSNVLSATTNVMMYFHQNPVPGRWYGSRVTSYGANTASTAGVTVTPGNQEYGTPVQITASTANPIKYMQLGNKIGSGSIGTNVAITRIGPSANVHYVEDLLSRHNSTNQTIENQQANFVLSHMNFNVPAGSELWASISNYDGEGAGGGTHEVVVYGVS